MKRLFDLTLLIVLLPFWGSVVLICYFLNVLFEGFPGLYSSIRYVGNEKNAPLNREHVL